MDFTVALNKGKMKFLRFLKVFPLPIVLKLSYEYVIRIFLFKSNFHGGRVREVGNTSDKHCKIKNLAINLLKK